VIVALPARGSGPRHAATGRAARGVVSTLGGPARVGAVLGGVATVAVVGGWLGLLLAVAVGVVLDRLLRRLEPGRVRRDRLRAAADVPLAADLLAAVLCAGAPVDRAADAVGQALGGPLGERLRRVARALRLGAPSEEAWAHLDGVAGGDRVSHAAIRSAASGAALATSLRRLADDLRAQRRTDADAAARRAGVLVVLPLGLCFLPAFVLAGLVPVVIAVLDTVL
jgi:pilus assembly protein TadC